MGMGWTSTNDPLSNTHMTMDFLTKEDAIKFAQSNGWTFVVQETSHVNRKLTAAGPIKYADNFRWKGPSGKEKMKTKSAEIVRPFPDLYIPPPPPKYSAGGSVSPLRAAVGWPLEAQRTRRAIMVPSCGW